MFSEEDIQLMLNGKSVDRYNEYKYLGVPTLLPNDYVKLLCDRLSQRLRPLKTLANRIAGVNKSVPNLLHYIHEISCRLQFPATCHS